MGMLYFDVNLEVAMRSSYDMPFEDIFDAVMATLRDEYDSTY